MGKVSTYLFKIHKKLAASSYHANSSVDQISACSSKYALHMWLCHFGDTHVKEREAKKVQVFPL